MSENDENENIIDILNELSKRIASLELKVGDSKAQGTDEISEIKPADQQTTDSSASSNDVSYGKAKSNNDNTCEVTHKDDTSIEIQKEYQAIKDAVAKVHLDPSLRLCEGPCPAGNNKPERAVYFQLTKSARYIETALKLIKLLYCELDNANGGPVDTTYPYIDQLTTVLKAHMESNQKEYQAVLVASQFDAETAKVFRTLQKNTSCFTNEGIAQLKVAAELAAITQGQKQNRPANFANRSFQRNQYSFRNNNRGHRQFRGGRPNQGRDHFHQIADQFSYPPTHPNDGGD